MHRTPLTERSKRSAPSAFELARAGGREDLTILLLSARAGFTLAGADYGAVLAWFGSTLNAGLLAVTAVVFCLFASLAWKVILEDYVPGSSRPALIMVSNLIFLVLAGASVFFIVRLALGSAPLPAGV
jgi:succinate dehydrogenase / fumarate reductase membrane anchor subunit